MLYRADSCMQSSFTLIIMLKLMLLRLAAPDPHTSHLLLYLCTPTYILPTYILQLKIADQPLYVDS